MVHRSNILKPGDLREWPEESDDTECEVENILDHMTFEGVTYYLIKWSGYECRVGVDPRLLGPDEWIGDNKGHWEPEENLTDCMETLIEYMQRPRLVAVL